MANNILGSLIINLITKANTTGLTKTDKAVQKTTKALKNMSKETGFISKLSGKLFGGINISSISQWGRQYLQFEKDLGAMHSRFYAITKDEEKAKEEFEFVRKLATQTANDIKSTADSYSIFYSATAKYMGKEGARGVFQDWTEVGRVLHLTPYQLERITYALREMSSKGKLYAQDLQMQIGTHVPGAVSLATEAIQEMGIKGVNTLEEFQKASKNNIPMINKFITIFSKKAKEAYASPDALRKALQQPDALAQIISNIGYNFLVDFSKAGGSYLVVRTLQRIADLLLKIDYQRITQMLGSIARFVTDYFPQIMWTLSAILRVVAMYQIAKFLNFMGSTFKLVRAIFSGGKGLFTAIRTMLKFGSVGRIITSSLLAFAKGGLRTALTTALGVTGPLGWLVGALLWLPEIVNIIKWIKNKMGFDDKRKIISNISKRTGLEKSVVESRLYEVSKWQSKTPDELAGEFRKRGWWELTPYVDISQDQKFYINIDGEYLPLSSMGDSFVRVEDKTSTIDSKYGPKPLSREETIKLGQQTKKRRWFR